jgi:hypothetical protein
MMGMLGEHYRLPMVSMSPNNRQQIQKIAEDLGLLRPVGARE